MDERRGHETLRSAVTPPLPPAPDVPQPDTGALQAAIDAACAAWATYVYDDDITALIGAVCAAAPHIAAPIEAERDEARAELKRWRSGQRVRGLRQVESVPDGIQFAAALVRSVGTEGGEAHDDLLVGASQRLKNLADASRDLLAEAVALRARLATAERERDEAQAAADDYALQFQTEAELAKTTGVLLRRTEAERDAARDVLGGESARRATAERDALLRAADEIPPTADLMGDGSSPEQWLRDRAAAVGTEETT